MPDVNLLKDTEKLMSGATKPMPPGPPELTTPAAASGQGLGGVFKSLFNRRPRTLPTTPMPPPVSAPARMTTMKTRGSERILTESKRPAPAVIPLPDEDDRSYNVNLLSEDLITTVNPRRRAILLGVVALGALLVVGLAYGGLAVYQRNVKQHITDTQQRLTAVKERITDLARDQQQAAVTVQKLSAIRSLVDRHTRWTKFFALLERYTLPEVTYGPSFSGDLNGTVTLTATTTGYEQAARQYLIFQQLVRDQKFISAFSITGAASQAVKEGPPKTTFAVSMTLWPNDFTMTADEFDQASGSQSTGPAPAAPTNTSTPSGPSLPSSP